MNARISQRRSPSRRNGSAHRCAGFTLVELMIAMLLGLIVIAGVTSVFLAGQKSYRTNNALANVQDSSRVAFELMARDIREAGFTGCGTSRIADLLNNGPANGGTTWWANWDNAVHGYASGTADPAVTTGAAAGNRVSAATGTDSLEVLSANVLPVRITAADPVSAEFTLNAAAPSNLEAGDVILVCDPDHVSITQTTTVNGTLVDHAASGTPGNCTSELNYPVACGANDGNGYQYSNNATMGKLDAVDWYIGHNDDEGTSLYRISLENDTGTPTASPQEMVRNVKGMTITYLQSGNTDFVAADAVTNWADVTAVHVELELVSTFQRATVDATKPITRKFAFTTTVRNRVQ
ncbi:MAG TPA: prepilin-type N-terminal cleavage/methylation domain-containing protein [Rhodanobacteraceae bacterium]|nr:prepilin-type N-terminal cleavage/methylation domain-containing protein [Rhodanobacteraceae bacterium]